MTTTRRYAPTSPVSKIPVVGVLPIAGAVQSGLKWHPDGRYVAYPLGSTIVVKDTTTNKQVFLSGHTDRITAVAMSPDGRFLASGQRTNMGFKVRAPFDVGNPGHRRR